MIPYIRILSQAFVFFWVVQPFQESLKYELCDCKQILYTVCICLYFCFVYLKKETGEESLAEFIGVLSR